MGNTYSQMEHSRTIFTSITTLMIRLSHNSLILITHDINFSLLSRILDR